MVCREAPRAVRFQADAVLVFVLVVFHVDEDALGAAEGADPGTGEPSVDAVVAEVDEDAAVDLDALVFAEGYPGRGEVALKGGGGVGR